MDASLQTEAEQAKILEILSQFQAEVAKRFDALEAKMQTEIQVRAAFQKSVSEDLAAVKGDLAAVKGDSMAMMIKLSNFQATFDERLQSVEQDIVQLQQPESSESKRGAGHARSEAADMGQ